MNNDGWGFGGAGASDKRLEGDDLQHVKQLYTNGRTQPRMVTHYEESGGPMKHHELDGSAHPMHHPMHQHLEEEKMRHSQAMDHHMHHIAKHHGRHYDSQHGHDTYKYDGQE